MGQLFLFLFSASIFLSLATAQLTWSNYFKRPDPVKPLIIPVVPELNCPEIKTSNGLIRGLKIETNSKKYVCAFYGIPFAIPPVGELRFKRPIPSGNWDGVLDATKFPNSCVQAPRNGGQTLWSTNTNISEDCLYLNILAPLSKFTSTGLVPALAPSPVMIWIHGGSLTGGSSTAEIYNGTTLAGDYDIVYASLQYRLGPLGFSYSGTEEVPGNMGLLDQNLAMQWIYDNVAQFGGNPNKITLFGESAGSICVSYHLLSPLSRHLFNRAILMSGVGSSPVSFKPPERVLEIFYEVATALGCNTADDDVTTDKTEIIACLRELDATKFVNVPYKTRRFLDGPFGLTVDGYFMPDSPNNMLNEHRGARADIIIGDVATEASLFMMYEFSKYFNGMSQPSLSYDTFELVLRELLRDKSDKVQDAVISRFTNWENPDDGIKNAETVVQLAGDYSFLCPDVEFATKWAERGLNVHFYMFTEHPDRPPMNEWMGSMHGDEVEFLFGHTLGDPNKSLAEKALSLQMMRLFTNFARNGNPSTNWERFTSAYPVFLDLNATIISTETPTNVFGPHADECNFWNNELPLIHTE